MKKYVDVEVEKILNSEMIEYFKQKDKIMYKLRKNKILWMILYWLKGYDIKIELPWVIFKKRKRMMVEISIDILKDRKAYITRHYETTGLMKNGYEYKL